MKKRAIIIVAGLLCLIIVWGVQTPKEIPYDDYDKMVELAELSEIQLKEMGFSNREILKIQSFPKLHDNYIWLSSMIECDGYKNYGYNNRYIFSKPEIATNVLQKSDEITLTSSVLDYFMEDTTYQYKGRILAEVHFEKDPTFNRYNLEVSYPHFGSEAVYSVARFICKENHSNYVDLMVELPGENFFSEISCEIDSEKILDGKPYILDSVFLIIDVGSDIMGKEVKFDSGFTVSFSGLSVIENNVCLGEEKILLSGSGDGKSLDRVAVADTG